MALLAYFRITEVTRIPVKARSTRLMKSKNGATTFMASFRFNASHTGKGTLAYLCLLSTKILELLHALNYNRGLDDKQKLLT